MNEISYHTEWITPEVANRMLDRNTHNRPLKQGDILKWATEMEAGNWQLNGEAIKVATNGDVLDGQHRLYAVALQDDGKAIPFTVIRGLAPEAQKTMDQGRRRDLADILSLEGVDASRSLAAAIRMFLAMDRGLLFVDRKQMAAVLSTTVLADWAVENEDLVDLMRNALRFKQAKLRPGILCPLYAMVAAEHGIEVADEFFGRLNDGVGLEEDSPILAFRNRLDHLRSESKVQSAQRLSDRDLMGMTISVFNNWITGKSITKIQRPHGGTWNEKTFPQIINEDGLRRSRIARKARRGA
jgi:hypothetical protein